jgi:hypothetical protein
VNQWRIAKAAPMGRPRGGQRQPSGAGTALRGKGGKDELRARGAVEGVALIEAAFAASGYRAMVEFLVACVTDSIGAVRDPRPLAALSGAVAALDGARVALEETRAALLTAADSAGRLEGGGRAGEVQDVVRQLSGVARGVDAALGRWLTDSAGLRTALADAVDKMVREGGV